MTDKAELAPSQLALMTGAGLVIELEDTVIELTSNEKPLGPIMDRLRLIRREIVGRMSR